MGSEWRETTWGEEVSLEYGKALRGYDAATGKCRVFGSNGPIGWTENSLAAGPGVILGRKGAYRGVRFSRDPFWVIDTAYFLKPKAELDMRWLYYAALHYKLGDIDDGSPIPSTTRAAVYAQKLAVSPIVEQRAIAAVLGAFDDRIDNLRQTNATLEAIAQALFKSWFVDFDPVRAKADGREPEGMDAATAALFPSEFVKSEIGCHPSGWHYVASGKIYDVGIGKTPPRKEPQWFSKSPEDVCWVSIRDMGDGGSFIANSSEYLTEEAIRRFNVRVVPDGTVLMSFKLTVGRLAITDGPLTTNEAIAHFKAKAGSLPQTFLYCWLREFDMGSLASTSSIAVATNSKAIRELKILQPGNGPAEAFARRVAPIFERIRVQQRQVKALAAIRDVLLPRLISGKLRLPDAEREIEVATA